MLQKNELDESIALFTEVLSQANNSYLGIKSEAATHYNLGVAYLRKENPFQAAVQFKAMLDTMLASLFAKLAQKALERLRNKPVEPPEKKPPVE